MRRRKAIRHRRRQALRRALLVGAAGVFAPALAHAHFVLVTPESSMSQSKSGFPEKLGPCGDEGGGTPTGAVTAFHPGQTIVVTISEVVPHPGHYRVALAVNDRSELPAEPLVTPTADDPCASAAIQDPPTFPILADNMLPHTQAFTTPQTFTVTLPADVTCAKCTLQVLETMSRHGAPCFYHHCADISIQGEVTPVPTATPVACAGDCDAGGDVTVNELVAMVTIALGNAPPAACPHGVPGGVAVDIALIIQAVNNALYGCGG